MDRHKVQNKTIKGKKEPTGRGGFLLIVRWDTLLVSGAGEFRLIQPGSLRIQQRWRQPFYQC